MSSMKYINVLPLPSPHSLIPNLLNPLLIKLSYNDSDVVKEEKLILFFKYYSCGKLFKNLFTRAVLPVPALPTNIKGFY